MLSEYWWVILSVILLLMIFYPKQNTEINKQFRKRKRKLSLNFNPILKNMNSLTHFYIKHN